MSKLTKDKRVNLRIPRMLKRFLEDNGYTMQGIFDAAVKKIVDIRLKSAAEYEFTLKQKPKKEEDFLK